MENFEQSGTNNPNSQDKVEYKEEFGPDQVKGMLREWLNALEENRDFTFTIKGQNCRVPKEAFFKGRTKAEFEFKQGEYELELELKWKESDLTSQQ
ncbi:MAG: hypothetical protein H0V66_11755 [Bdellovibrionales bacterium]|nr:hypothetical protein [Bdellovibrionales bacterium]